MLIFSSLILFVCVSLYCAWLGIKTKEKEFLLWIAAVIVFGSEAVTLAGSIKAHYKEPSVVKEVKI